MTMHRVLAAAVLLGSSSASVAGVTFTQVTTVDGQRTTVTRVSSDAGKAKMEIVESPDNPFMPPGSYMLVSDGEIVLVNPAARTYARFDPAEMMGAVAGMAEMMQITDVTSEKTLDEPGESIEGYPTRHYQFKSSWTMGVQGMPIKTEITTVEDLWATTAIEMPATPPTAASGMPAQVMEVVEAQGLRQIEGVPLKHVSVQSTKSSMGAMPGLGALGARLGGRILGGGRGGRGGGGGEDGGGGGAAGGATTTTIESVDIEEIDVPAATFELPDGYQETSLLQTGPAVPNLNRVPEAPAVPNLNDLN
jgi:hypothetical protein